VEAAGVEPASGSIPLKHLRTCPEYWCSPNHGSPGQDSRRASL